MMSSLLSASCARMVSLQANQGEKMSISPFQSSLSHFTSPNSLLGIDEDDEHEEENEEGVSLLEVAVPECLGDVREAVAGEQATHLAEQTTGESAAKSHHHRAACEQGRKQIPS